MLAADVAECALAKVCIYFAEVVCVQEWAAVMGEQLEMAILDVGAELVAECPRDLAVGFLRCLVYVDFPPDTAGVRAP